MSEKHYVLHEKCGGEFDPQSIKVKSTCEYETGTELIFNCPCCGEETDTLSCN